MKTRLLALTLLASACASPSHLAKVNGDAITRHELRAEFKRRHGGHEKMLGMAELTRSFLDRVIDRRLLLQEGYRLGLDRRPEVRQVRAVSERKRGVERLLQLEIDEKAVPTEAEIRAFHETRTGTLFETRQIVSATRDEAEAIRAELLAGADFEALARARSIGPSAQYGGRLMPLGWGAMDAAWEEAVFTLEPGKLSPVLENAGNFEVVELLGKKTVDRPPLAKARERIKAVLAGRKKKERERDFAAELWAKHQVKLAALDLGDEAVAKPAGDEAKAPAATWNGGQATRGALAAALDRDALAKLTAARRTAEVQRTLRQLVNEELAIAEARARRLENDPVVAVQVRDAVEDAMEVILYNEYILKDVSVSDAEIATYYAENKAKLKTEEKRLIAHILVDTEAEAVALRKRIDDGEPFADLARARSKDAETGKRGGNLGPVTRGDVPAELAVVLELREGEVSAPLKTKYGWHLMKILGILPEREQTLDEVREDLRKVVKRKKVDEQRGFWVKRLRADARIAVNERELKKLADEVLVPGASATPTMPAGHGKHSGGMSASTPPHPR